MVDAYVAYQSPVNRGQAQQIEGMARAFAVAFDAAPAAAAAEPTFNLAPDEAEVARFRTVLAAAIAEPYLTKAHVPNMHSDAAPAADVDVNALVARLEFHALRNRGDPDLLREAAAALVRMKTELGYADDEIRRYAAQFYTEHDRAEAAEAEVARLTRHDGEWEQCAREVKAERDSLRERLAAAQKDAVRLDWILSALHQSDGAWIGSLCVSVHQGGIRAAIDAAIKAAKP
jgi:hypothetical protein